jgi:thiol-disulfide isomerase/thioredoxin
MKYMLCIYFILLGTCLQAQRDTLPPYLQVKIIPPFQLLQPDSSWFKKADLPKKMPVVMVYFNPDCGHCQIEAKEIADSLHLLKNFFFVFSSYQPLDEIAFFADSFRLSGKPNIVFGRDTKYFIPAFFRVKTTPFTAVYDKKGNLLQAFEKGVTPGQLKKLIE